VAVWRSGNGVAHINEVTPRYHVCIPFSTEMVCNLSLRPTQPSSLNGTGNEYPPKIFGTVLQLGR